MLSSDQILMADQDTGDPFGTSVPFIVFLDIYTDGWYVEYAANRDDIEDKNNLNWKRYHNQSIQQHGELSKVLVYGMPDVLYRLNSGAQGATAYRQTTRIIILR